MSGMRANIISELFHGIVNGLKQSMKAFVFLGLPIVGVILGIGHERTNELGGMAVAWAKDIAETEPNNGGGGKDDPEPKPTPVATKWEVKAELPSKAQVHRALQSKVGGMPDSELVARIHQLSRYALYEFVKVTGTDKPKQYEPFTLKRNISVVLANLDAPKPEAAFALNSVLSVRSADGTQVTGVPGLAGHILNWRLAERIDDDKSDDLIVKPTPEPVPIPVVPKNDGKSETGDAPFWTVRIGFPFRFQLKRAHPEANKAEQDRLYGVAIRFSQGLTQRLGGSGTHKIEPAALLHHFEELSAPPDGIGEDLPRVMPSVLELWDANGEVLVQKGEVDWLAFQHIVDELNQFPQPVPEPPQPLGASLQNPTWTIVLRPFTNEELRAYCAELAKQHADLRTISGGVGAETFFDELLIQRGKSFRRLAKRLRLEGIEVSDSYKPQTFRVGRRELYDGLFVATAEVEPGFLPPVLYSLLGAIDENGDVVAQDKILYTHYLIRGESFGFDPRKGGHRRASVVIHDDGEMRVHMLRAELRRLGAEPELKKVEGFVREFEDKLRSGFDAHNLRSIEDKPILISTLGAEVDETFTRALDSVPDEHLETVLLLTVTVCRFMGAPYSVKELGWNVRPQWSPWPEVRDWVEAQRHLFSESPR